MVNKIWPNFEDFLSFCFGGGFFLVLITKNIFFVFTAGFRRSFRLSRKDKKTNKSMYECKKSDQYDTADVPTYEEVTPYRRQMHEKYRLVVLVGKCSLLCVILMK